MQAFNIYYNNEKINSNPLTAEELVEAVSHKYINKYDRSTKTMKRINTDNIQIIRCTIV